MRTAGFDKETIDSAVNKRIIEAIQKVSCPKCNKSATNISIENGKLCFEACCEELRQTIMNKFANGSL